MMKRVYQRHTDTAEPKKGDCFAACVATILGYTLDELPNFCAAEGDWWDLFQQWLCDRGLQAIEFKVDFANLVRDGGTMPFGSFVVDTPVILTGASPRGPWLHSVVALYYEEDRVPGERRRGGFHYYHDPHPQADADPSKWFAGWPIQILVFGLVNPGRGLKRLNSNTQIR